VYIRSGLYDQFVTIQNSGTAGNHTIFCGYPGDQKPIMRGFRMVSKDHVKIIGISIIQDSLAGSGIKLDGTMSAIEVINCDFDSIDGSVISLSGDAMDTLVMRGNTGYMFNCPQVALECKGGGTLFNCGDGDYRNILIEYNSIERGGDFVDASSQRTIIRNNHLRDFRNTYYPQGLGDNLHCDIFQFGASFTSDTTRYQFYESNTIGENWEVNSHLFQIRTTDPNEHSIVMRGNVGYDNGSYIMQSGGIDSVIMYNNSYYNTNFGNLSVLRFNTETANASVGNFLFNNIFAKTGTSAIPTVESGNECQSDSNLCWSTGGGVSCINSTDFPQYIDTANNNFHISDASPARNKGIPIALVTSDNGTGTEFTVNHGKRFCDGFGIAEGDIIKIGAGTATRITAVSGNTITVASSVSWSTGDGIFWRNQDATPDIGAYEYKADYTYGISISSHTQNGLILTGEITITTAVTNPENVRMVEVFIDGLPQPVDYDYPFTTTWTNSKATSDTVKIIAVAYPLYADTVLSIKDTVYAITGESIPIRPFKTFFKAR
jgi:hypothetical protein